MVLTKNGLNLEISSRSSRCSGCEQRFLPETLYHSLIYRGEEASYEREDFCESCWTGRGENENKQGVHWKARVPKKEEKKKPLSPEQKEKRALELLKEAIQKGDNPAITEGFVLALYLARSRKLSFRSEIESEGRTLLLYEVKGSEEIIPVQKVDLHQRDIEIIQKSLAEKLSGEM